MPTRVKASARTCANSTVNGCMGVLPVWGGRHDYVKRWCSDTDAGGYFSDKQKCGLGHRYRRQACSHIWSVLVGGKCPAINLADISNPLWELSSFSETAKAAAGSIEMLLGHRYRRQASSHIWSVLVGRKCSATHPTGTTQRCQVLVLSLVHNRVASRAMAGGRSSTINSLSITLFGG